MEKQALKEIFSKRLAQARRMKGLSLRLLSEATGGKISYNALHRYEQAEMMPGDDVLLPIADALEKPLDFFFRPFTVKLEGLRFRKTLKLGVKSEEIIREQATDFFERYLEIEQMLGLPQNFEDQLGNRQLVKPEDAEDAAKTIREQWNLGTDPLPNVVETLENQGIKVFEIDSPDSFDGFSGWIGGHPVVVLAERLNDDLPRKRFTTLHEFAHVLIHPHSDMQEKQLEKCCHRFSGAMLMPAKVFEEDWGGYRRRVTLEELKDLKRRYGISIAAIMHRAHDLNLIDSALYQRFFMVYRSRGWHHDEPGDYVCTEKSHRFEQLVMRALAEEIISLGKAAGLLNLPVTDLRQRLGEFA